MVIQNMLFLRCSPVLLPATVWDSDLATAELVVVFTPNARAMKEEDVFLIYSEKATRARSMYSVTKIEHVNVLLDFFQKHGHSEVDSACVYAAETTEEFLLEAHWQDRGSSWRQNCILRSARI